MTDFFLSRAAARCGALALCLGLAACGGGNDDNGANAGATGGATPVASLKNDAFLSQVDTVIGGDENSPEVPIDNIVVTTPEDQEPAPLG